MEEALQQELHLGPITLSAGVAVYPDHGDDAATIVKAADVALFRAKSAGRNRTVMFEPIAGESTTANLSPPAVGA